MGFAQSITETQWRWLLERYLEGYLIRDLAAFVGIHPRTIVRHWEELGLRSVGTKNTLISLKARKEEFLKLGKEEKKNEP